MGDLSGQSQKVGGLDRANEVGFLVAPRRDSAAFSEWWRRCIQLAWPCVTVLVRGRFAEVRADSFTARRQVFSPGACRALRALILAWSARVGPRASNATGPVVFALDRVPTEDAEQLAHELLAAARRDDPAAFSHPRTEVEAKRRAAFLVSTERERDFGRDFGKPKTGKPGASTPDEDEPPPPSLTKAEWSEIIATYSGVCAYCERSGLLLIQDQIVPAVSGGKHVRGNVVPACVECNMRKAGRLAAEFVTVSDDLPARRLRAAFGIPAAVAPPRKKKRK